MNYNLIHALIPSKIQYKIINSDKSKSQNKQKYHYPK